MADQTIQDECREEDFIDILVATDCHLGYQETDPIIGDDSFNTFEEILMLAVEHDVDMILLGGDLFHHNNPSQKSMNRCMSLLRQYTMGNRPVYLEVISGSAITHRPGCGDTVNYLDPNLNVSIPVFSIHGNHDDPSGQGMYSSLDTLSSAGLVNYFGKWTDLNNVEIKPILLKKGETFLALYGLSHIKDERLSRLFLEEKVTMVKPKEMPENWFNVCVLHQNRVDRGPKRFIQDSYLPSFLHFVVWGHEHDCDIVPMKTHRGFYITQPGSSVPTSLAEGETKPKHVGLLQVYKKSFKFTPLKLQTTRPFIFDTIQLYDVPLSNQIRDPKAISDEMRYACEQRVEELIKKSKELLTGHPRQPTIPFIRLRVDYDSETQLFNIVKFGQTFYQRVANPNTEVIKLHKLTNIRDKTHIAEAKSDIKAMREIYAEEPFAARVDNLIRQYFTEHAEKKMIVLTESDMGTAVETFIEKDDTNAIVEAAEKLRKSTIDKLMVLEITEQNIMEELLKINGNLGDGFVNDVQKMSPIPNDSDDELIASVLEDDVALPSVVQKKATRGRGRGRPKTQVPSTRDEDNVSRADTSVSTRGARGARGRGSQRGTTRGRATAIIPSQQQPLNFLRLSQRPVSSTSSTLLYDDDSE